MMVSLTEDQKDAIYNGLLVGMAPEDCFLLAKLDATTIMNIADDDEMQLWIRSLQKNLEFNLLDNMRKGTQIQVAAGKTDGTQWLLEHLFPRYSAKAAPDIGTINLVLKGGENTDDIEMVENGTAAASISCG